MRFSDIERGTLARKRVTWSMLDGRVAYCDVRVITGAEDQQIMLAAGEHARTNGASDVPGTPFYDFEIAVQAVALFCLDADEPEKQVRFFKSADEVRESLERNRINFIYDHQQTFQRALSPLQHRLSPDEYTHAVATIASAPEDAPSPFETWPLALQRSFLRTTAVLALNSPTFKSSAFSGGSSGSQSSAA